MPRKPENIDLDELVEEEKRALTERLNELETDLEKNDAENKIQNIDIFMDKIDTILCSLDYKSINAALNMISNLRFRATMLKKSKNPKDDELMRLSQEELIKHLEAVLLQIGTDEFRDKDGQRITEVTPELIRSNLWINQSIQLIMNANPSGKKLIKDFLIHKKMLDPNKPEDDLAQIVAYKEPKNQKKSNDGLEEL